MVQKIPQSDYLLGREILDKFEELSEEKFNKYLMKIAKSLGEIVRKTHEYKKQVENQKNGVENCEICDIEFDYKKGIEKHLHHEPLTLAEIIYNIINIDYISKGNYEFSSIDIIKDTLNAHVKGLVDFMIICDCCHRRIHKQRKA